MPSRYSIYDPDKEIQYSGEDTVLIDEKTGEQIPAYKINKRYYGDNRNFDIVYLTDFLAAFKVINNKQVDVVAHILEHRNPATNYFIGTYKQISRDVGVSEPTIAQIMKLLQKVDIIKKVQNGVWQINPRTLVRGDRERRQALIIQYENLSLEEKFISEGEGSVT